MGDPLPVPDRRASRTSARRSRALLLAGARRLHGRAWSFNAAYGVLQLLAAQGGRNLDNAVLSPLTGGASSINIYGAVERAERLPAERAHRRPEPPRDHADRPAARPAAALPAPRARPPAARAARGRARASCSSSSSRRCRAAACSGSVVGLLVLALPYRRRLLSRALARPARRVARAARDRRPLAPQLLRDGDPLAHPDRAAARRRRTSTSTTSSRTCSRRTRCSGSASTTSRSTTSSSPARRTGGRTRSTSRCSSRPGSSARPSSRVFLWYLFRRLRAARALGRALAGAQRPAAARVRPLAWGLTAALAGTLAANVFYLTMTFYYFYVSRPSCSRCRSCSGRARPEALFGWARGRTTLLPGEPLRTGWESSSSGGRGAGPGRSGRTSSRTRASSVPRVERDGAVFLLPTRQKSGVDRVQKAKWKEQPAPRRRVADPRAGRRSPRRLTFVDIGAHIGTTMIAAIRRFGFDVGRRLRARAGELPAPAGEPRRQRARRPDRDASTSPSPTEAATPS